MSAINEIRTVMQDFLAPELQELNVRIEAVERQVQELKGSTERQFQELKGSTERRFEEVNGAIGELRGSMQA